MTTPRVPRGVAAGFALRMAIWIAALLGLLRLPWVQKQLLIPFAGLQQQLACAITSAPRDAVAVDLSCTGADAMALCLGAILAFPATWLRRLGGCAVGLALIAVLNTARIGSLSLLTGSRDLFQLLHLYLWPAAIIVVTAGFVFLWMSSAGRGGGLAELARPPGRPASPARRFLGLTLLFAALYYVGAAWFLGSQWLLAVGNGVAATAGLLMSAAGAPAEVTGNQLTTASGAWVVTQQCVATPLIAVYLAAAFALVLPPLKRALAILAAVPIFLLLATARLLVLALPETLVAGSYTVAIHAFYQVIAAFLSVFVIARLRPGASWTESIARALPAVGIGAVAGGVVGAWHAASVRPLLAHLSESAHLGHGWVDPQGALDLLPALQIGLFAALLWLRRGRRDLGALTAAWLFLLLLQAAAVVGFGELARHAPLEPPIVVIRALALIVPLALAWPLDRRGGSRPASLAEATATQAG